MHRILRCFKKGLLSEPFLIVLTSAFFRLAGRAVIAAPIVPIIVVVIFVGIVYYYGTARMVFFHHAGG